VDLLQQLQGVAVDDHVLAADLEHVAHQVGVVVDGLEHLASELLLLGRW
jgi:hypothetical protein